MQGTSHVCKPLLRLTEALDSVWNHSRQAQVSNWSSVMTTTQSGFFSPACTINLHIITVVEKYTHTSSGIYKSHKNLGKFLLRTQAVVRLRALLGRGIEKLTLMCLVHCLKEDCKFLKSGLLSGLSCAMWPGAHNYLGLISRFAR